MSPRRINKSVHFDIVRTTDDGKSPNIPYTICAFEKCTHSTRQTTNSHSTSLHPCRVLTPLTHTVFMFATLARVNNFQMNGGWERCEWSCFWPNKKKHTTAKPKYTCIFICKLIARHDSVCERERERGKIVYIHRAEYRRAHQNDTSKAEKRQKNNNNKQSGGKERLQRDGKRRLRKINERTMTTSSSSRRHQQQWHQVNALRVYVCL